MGRRKDPSGCSFFSMNQSTKWDGMRGILSERMALKAKGELPS